jgi:hypothetical protein
VPFLLVEDELDYYCRYLQSLGPAASDVLPVLTTRPASTAAILEQVGLPVLPGPAARPPGHIVALGRELCGLLERGDTAGVTAYCARLRERWHLGGGRRPAYVVGVGRSAGLGGLRALADGRRFLAVACCRDERVARLAERATSLYVVAEQVADEDVGFLQQATAARPRHGVLEGVLACPFGLLNARTFEAMTLVDAKQRLAAAAPRRERVSVFVDCYLDRAPANPAEGVVATPYRLLTREVIAGRRDADLLALTSHGMSDLVHVNGDYVCGRSPHVEECQPESERLPSCTEEGGLCFFKPEGRALRAHELPADHVFVNSCGSLRLRRSDFDPLFNLCYSALEGRARSFVGSDRVKDGRGSEGLLYHHLLRSGFTLGQATCLLNLALFSNQLEVTPDVFRLLGDPEERVATGGGAGPAGLLVEGENHVAVGGGFAILRITAPDLVRAFERSELFVYPEGGEPLFVTMVPASAGEGLYVFLLSYSDLGGQVRVGVRKLSDVLARVRDASELVEQNLGGGLGAPRFYPDSVRHGGRKNLENRLLSVARLCRAAFASAAEVKRLLASCEELEREMDRLDAATARWLHERISAGSFRPAEQYQDVFLLTRESPDAACPYCAGSVAHRCLHHVLRPALRRVQLVCPFCGVIEDRPDVPLSVQILLQDPVRRGTRLPFTVRFVNGTGRQYRGRCAAGIRRSARFAVRLGEPVRQVTIPAGAVTELDFEVHLGEDVPVHRYTAQAALVSSCQVFFAGRYFSVIGRQS